MNRKDTKGKGDQGYDVEKVIDTIEKAISVAVTVYQAAESIIKAMFKPDENNTDSKSK